MEEQECSVCQCDETPDELSIICQNKHFVCSCCAGAFIQSAFSTPEASIPFKCSNCKVLIEKSQIEKHLDAKQKHIYEVYSKFVTLDSKKYRIHSCPSNCGYIDILNMSQNDCPFFTCQNEDCKKGSCTICLRFYKNPDVEALSEEQYTELVSGPDGIYSHLNCFNKKGIKEEWEACLEKGTSRSCPKCGFRGMKDGECTHIKCPKCSTTWCYVCGLDEDACDKEEIQDGIRKEKIFGHNEDWKTNPKRCPLYLYEVHPIDDRYTEEDNQCKEFLHKLLLYKEVREFINKHSEEVLNEVFETFPAISNHGVDIEEAMTADLTIIKR